MALGVDHRIRIIGIDDGWKGTVRLTLLDTTSENAPIELSTFDVNISDAQRGHELIVALRGEKKLEKPFTLEGIEAKKEEVRSFYFNRGMRDLSMALNIPSGQLHAAIRKLQEDQEDK